MDTPSKNRFYRRLINNLPAPLPAPRSPLPASRSPLPAARSPLPASRSTLSVAWSTLPAPRSPLPAARSFPSDVRRALMTRQSHLMKRSGICRTMTIFHHHLPHLLMVQTASKSPPSQMNPLNLWVAWGNSLCSNIICWIYFQCAKCKDVGNLWWRSQKRLRRALLCRCVRRVLLGMTLDGTLNHPSRVLLHAIYLYRQPSL